MGTGDFRTGGARALFAAVYAGDEDAVVGALRAGASPGSVDAAGQTVLYLAAVSDEPGVVRLLLAAGAEPDQWSAGSDLPLCGAACGGHVEVVGALLAAGARVDAAEEFGFTALDWAVRLGYAGVLEVLLAAGADPDRAVAGGVAPLVVAAERGSFSAVRLLRAREAGGVAQALAAAWEGLRGEVREETREAALAQAGAGAVAEVVVREVVEDGGITVVAEAFGDGVRVGAAERQTGHGAICTLLERAAGTSTPYAELAGRALRDGARGRGLDNWAQSVEVLVARGGEETFQAVAAWCAREDAVRRAFAADVLGGLADARAVPLLRRLLREAREPVLLLAALEALARYGDRAGETGAGAEAAAGAGAGAALPEVLRCVGHRSAAVRRAVARALAGHPAGAGALAVLAGDPDAGVREEAAEALREPVEVPERAGEIRECLAALLDDLSPGVRVRAASALALRGDPRAPAALAALLADAPLTDPARPLAVRALPLIRDEAVRGRVAATAVRAR